MQRPLATLALVVLAALTLACGPGGDSPAVDTAGVSDIELGADENGQPMDTQGCMIADSAGGYTWRCRVGRHLVARVTPSYAAPDSNGSRALQWLVVRYEGALAPRRTDSLEFGEYMNRLEPYDVSTADLDGDGWADLRLRHHYGIAANEGHYVWRWQPSGKRFAWDGLLSEETNVSPDSTGCVQTFGSIGHGGQDQIETHYCLTNDEWVEVARREQQWSDSLGGAWETYYERRGDSLVVVREGPAQE